MDTPIENNTKENTLNELPPTETVHEKTPVPHHQDPQPRRSRKEERSKKDDKAVEIFLKSLNGVPSVEEKFSLVCKKYAETADENRRLHAVVKQSDKRLVGVLKEKEQLQLECNRTVLVKSKLENLCRELQKQNKAIKDDSLLKIREEEERRKETQAKFQSTLSEITALLQQNNDKNAKLRDDNINMTKRFKSVVEQYELREQQVDKMAKQMSLESQLSEAKLAKAGLESQAEKERMLSEMEQLRLELAQCHAKIMECQGTETALKSQISMYTDKYDEFQTALVRSNQVFGGFKGEMEKMSKKILKLEKESLSWKKRWETSQTALLEMCSDKQSADERSAATDRQLAQMQRLCRTMQGERTLLLNTLKEHNIERPPLPVLPPAPPAPPAPTGPNNVDAMAANCAQLKQSLAQLQNQLNVLTTKKAGESQEEPQKVEPAPKSKKGKGKKNKADREANVAKVMTPQENVINMESVESTTLSASLVEANEVNNVDANIVELKDEIPEITTKVEPELIAVPAEIVVKEEVISTEVPALNGTADIVDKVELASSNEVLTTVNDSSEPVLDKECIMKELDKILDAQKLNDLCLSPTTPSPNDMPYESQVKVIPSVDEVISDALNDLDNVEVVTELKNLVMTPCQNDVPVESQKSQNDAENKCNSNDVCANNEGVKSPCVPAVQGSVV